MTDGLHTPTCRLQLSQVADPMRCSTKWDDFIVSLKNGHVLQSTAWAAYKRKLGWRPYPMSWSAEGSLRAVCLVLHRRVAGLPFGGFLYVPRGPVLDYESPEAPLVLSEILDTLSTLARRRLALVRISPDVSRTATWVNRMLVDKGFQRAQTAIQHTTTFRLDLTQPLETVVAGMAKHRRREVHKHERDGTGWSFHADSSSDYLQIFYRLYHQTLTRAGMSPKSFDDIRLMHETLAPYGSSFVFIVKHQDRPVAGAMWVGMGKRRLWAFYGGSAKGEDAVSGAVVVLRWEIIKWAKRNAYAEYGS